MIGIRGLSLSGERSRLTRAALVALNKFGTDAHVWIPGIGYFNGLQAGNYIDSAGTQAGLVDNPVGLVMDAEGSLGAELRPNGWTGGTTNTGSSIVSNVLVMTSAPTGYAVFVDGTAFVANKNYVATLVYTNVTGNAQLLYQGSGVVTVTGSGTVTAVFNSGTISNARLQFNNNSGSNISGTVSISVREVTGAITATQGTTANKPILRRGAVNLLLRSEEFNTLWATTGTISVNAIAAPNATTTADLLTASATTFSGVAQQTFSGVASGATYTLSVFVKKNNWRYVGLRFNTSIFGATEQIPFYDFDTDTVSNGGVTAATITRTIIGDGWVRVAVTYTATTTGGGCQIWLTNSVGATQPAKSGTESVYIWGAQLELGSTASEYIPTTTAAASSSSGDYYWQFDGSNDSLALSGPVFQMSDDLAVVAGCRPLPAAYAQRVFSQASVSAGIELLVATNGLTQGRWDDDAGAAIFQNGPAGNILQSNTVISLLKRGNDKYVRANGVNGTVNTTVMGTSTFTAYSIGSSSGTSAYFNGSIYPVIAIKGTVSDADLLVLERWVGSLSGVSI